MGWCVSIHEQQLPHPVGRREQIALEAKEVAVAGVEAGDGAPLQVGHLVGDGHARDRGATEVAVGNEKCVAGAFEHGDLLAHDPHVCGGRRFDLANDLKPDINHAHS